MARLLIIESEIVLGVADGNDAAGMVGPGERRRASHGRGKWRPIARQKRVAGERVLDIGEKQFLMLLLMMKAELCESLEGEALRPAALFEKARNRGIDMTAIGQHIFDSGAR